MHRIKKIMPNIEQTFRDRQLCFYVKKLLVSEKTQKSELCHFSYEIYVIKFFTRQTQTYAKTYYRYTLTTTNQDKLMQLC